MQRIRKILGFEGPTLGRLKYFLINIGALVIFALITLSSVWLLSSHPNIGHGFALTNLAVILVLFFVVYMIKLVTSIRRMRDIGLSSLWIIVVIVLSTPSIGTHPDFSAPRILFAIISWAFFIFLCLKKGKTK